MEVYAWENISEEVLDKTYPLYSGETIEVSPHYNTALILNMDYGDLNGTKNVNKQGWVRDSKDYWKRMLELYPDAFSPDNKYRIEVKNVSPICNTQIIEYFKVYEYLPYKDQVLVHHHIGQDGQAVALPSGIHLGGETSAIHKIEAEIGITENAERHSKKVQEALEAGYIQTGDDVWSNVETVESLEGNISKFEYIQKFDSNNELFEKFVEWKQYEGDNVRLFELKELEYSTREERMLLDAGKASYGDYIKIKERLEFSEYLKKKDFLSDEQLVNKYNFLSDSDPTLDKFRLYEYQKTKSTTDLTDTKVYFDSEGKAIGLSCYADVPSETALELRLSDTENYLSDTDMSYKYTDYDTYSKIDKLKACQYDYECTKISDMIDNNLSSQNDIELMSYDDLKTKYTFIDDTTDADVIKELQIAEYRDQKYGTTTTDDIKLYYDENGKMSCISDQGYESIKDVEIKANAKFSADVTEVNQYRNAEYMSTICPEYDNLTPLQKLQLQQLELDARNHDMSKLHNFVANDTAGNLKNVRITYDADGVVSGIDTSGINDGNVLDISKSNTIIDISSDGNVSMRLDKPSTGKAWWQDELVCIINNDSIKTINEMTKRKNKGSNIGNIMEKVA